MPRLRTALLAACALLAATAATAEAGTPRAPRALTATASPSAVALRWQRAGDAAVVYRVTRDGRAIAKVRGRAFVDRAAKAGRRHAYTVRAEDRAGNRSRPARTVASTTGPATGRLPGWEPVFADTFDADTFATRWGSYDGAPDTSHNGRYDPWDVVRIHDGLLDMRIGRPGGGAAQVAAPFPKIANQTYGRYAVRFRADPVPGFKLAWLLWPVSERWPHDGEINFPEGDLDGGMNAFMHRLGATGGDDQDVHPTGTGFAAWHTAVIEWLPQSVTFLLDGRVVGRSTRRIPNTPMRWVLQTETSLDRAPAIGAAGHVQVDWVTVHRRA